MSTAERFTYILSKLDSTQSLVEHLQERVSALEGENLRQCQEFLEFRTLTERALGNPSLSRQRRLQASGEPSTPTPHGTPEVDPGSDDDPIPETSPNWNPPAPSPSTPPSTPQARDLVKIIGGKDKNKCKGNIYRVVRPKGSNYFIITTVNLEGPGIKKANISLAPATISEQGCLP